MKLYKLLYKPLGLYYTPNKGSGNNLTKIGKIYRIKPNPKQYNSVSVRGASWTGKQSDVQRLIAAHFNIAKNNLQYENYCKVDNSNWEVVEVQNEVGDVKIKPFLIVSTTGDKWEMCNGAHVVFAIDTADAMAQFKSNYNYSVISISELIYAPEKGYNEKIIEITQPVVE